MTDKSWEVVELVGQVHVIPLSDLGSHLHSGLCRCNPKVKSEPDAVPIYVHQSFDGRELGEVRPS